MGHPDKKIEKRLSLSIQADQLSSSAGGGRFIRGLLSALFLEPGILDHFEQVYIVTTQNESVACLGPLPPRVSVVKRRFPSRLRQTLLERLFGYTLPVVDVTYGPFYHVFPSHSRARIVTIHDLSCFNDQYHPQDKAHKTISQITRMVHDCDGVVCISDTTLREFKTRWPYLAHKAVMIYNGVAPVSNQLNDSREVRERDHSIVAVGTIEPRKNYPIILDAFERLVYELGDDAPLLILVGNKGWMCDEVVPRISALQASGKCRWLQNASDEELSQVYNTAGVFTYLSLYEGFGYPPFEAAFAGCPMVLSNASSIGEIWSQSATCVDPMDIEGIVSGWKWALSLSTSQRETVADNQARRAKEFTWGRAVHQYLMFWKKVVCNG
jgi:glycosyltransferase involved in cell wall biosynthesis